MILTITVKPRTREEANAMIMAVLRHSYGDSPDVMNHVDANDPLGGRSDMTYDYKEPWDAGLKFEVKDCPD